VAAVCEFGHRLLTLDAEDFASDADARSIPADLRRRARACHMPQTPRQRPRGAMDSMRPVFALLLEVIAIRWRRRELSPMIAAVHIASEYLPLLAFEPSWATPATPPGGRRGYGRPGAGSG